MENKITVEMIENGQDYCGECGRIVYLEDLSMIIVGETGFLCRGCAEVMLNKGIKSKEIFYCLSERS